MWITNQQERIQNCTVHLVANIPKHDRIQPVLKRLNWLPLKQLWGFIKFALSMSLSQSPIRILDIVWLT